MGAAKITSLLLAATVILVSAGVGCGDAARDEGPGIDRGKADQPQGSSACRGEALAGGTYERSVELDGVTREYDVHVPPQADGGAPLPLVLYFHPLMTDKAYFRAAGVIEKADAEGFVAVFPGGMLRSWNAGACCAPANGVGRDEPVDDLGFVREMLDAIESEACIDARRIYATGFSNGGFFSHRLACEMSERIAAIAAVSAVNGVPSDRCTPQRPIAVMTIHGTDDGLVPPAGGFSHERITDGAFISLEQSNADWVARNGCMGAPVESFVEGAARCMTYEGCEAGADVTTCLIDGAGHCWFGEPVCPLGVNSDDLDATDATWRFLSRHRLAFSNAQT